MTVLLLPLRPQIHFGTKHRMKFSGWRNGLASSYYLQEVAKMPSSRGAAS